MNSEKGKRRESQESEAEMAGILCIYILGSCFLVFRRRENQESYLRCYNI